MHILFLSSRDYFGDLAYQAISKLTHHSITSHFWNRNDTLRPKLSEWNGDWIISYRSDLILTPVELNRATKGAINIHPAPPKYRGVGGYFWAIYNQDTIYGATAHVMKPKLDSGNIIDYIEFPLHPNESVKGLAIQTGHTTLKLLVQILSFIQVYNHVSDIPTRPELFWGKRLYTYQDLEELMKMERFSELHPPSS
ncbi:MAG TPA: methionyl-tRNA formyltransferase [Cytophagales bacterium]|nr:methionyl-tRNA formyltransferase [Cytophagales bacterium]HAP60304.1 methionyl-tRNA formyltransferase [Cytophagales bacterium]